jgi:uncharacterized metal-binding protein
MPDGRTHDDITLVAASFAAPISLGLAFAGNPGQGALLIGSFLVSGLLFSDDLDIHSIEYKRWRLFRFLWLPYQKLVPHRSRLSHGLILGPALRILYFAAVFTIALWAILTALSQLVPLDASGVLGAWLSAIGRSIVDHPDWWAVAFAGFVLGGLVHSVADSLWTWWRHVWRAPVLRPDVCDRANEPTHHGMPVPDFAVRISQDVGEIGDQDSHAISHL